VRLVERAVGLRPDDAVYAQPAALLERAQRPVDRVVEDVDLTLVLEQTEANELRAQVDDDRPVVSSAKDLHRRMVAA